MLVIRDAQRRALAAVPRHRFLRSILSEARARHPELPPPGPGDAALLDLLERALERAPALGVVLEPDLRSYGALVLRRGRDPAEDPELAPLATDPRGFGAQKVADLARAAGLEG